MKRRDVILKTLSQHDKPLTGRQLAQWFEVSRQAIVSDIALLRAQGHEIVATPRGYQLQKPTETPSHTAMLAVTHAPEQTGLELNALVEGGVRVLNVIVEHPLYGDLVGSLMLTNREDVAAFLRRVQAKDAPLLSELTDGVHLHTVEFDHLQQFKDVETQLETMGFLYRRDHEDEPFTR